MAMRPKAKTGDPVYVFWQRNGIETGTLIDLRRYRVLQQNPVYVGVVVQFVNFG